MSEEQRRQLQQKLWNIANTLRGKIQMFINTFIEGMGGSV